jgi:hypothetical protein
MTPNMQKAQQQQPVYTQYQQAMTVGQQQQQVPQYASQQVPVVATATTPVLQFHPSASQPTQQKRECKPLLDVNPESGGAVNIDNAASAVAATQQQTSEKSTPQPVSNLLLHCIERHRLFVYLRLAGISFDVCR